MMVKYAPGSGSRHGTENPRDVSHALAGDWTAWYQISVQELPPVSLPSSNLKQGFPRITLRRICLS